MRHKLQAPGQPGILPRWISSAKSGVGLIVTDGRDFFSEEKRQTQQQIEYLAEGVPAFRLVNTCNRRHYRIEKEVLSDPHRDVVLQQVRFFPWQGHLQDYHLYALLAPHLATHGYGNTAWVGDYKEKHLR